MTSKRKVALLDAIGRPLVMPQWYGSTIEDFHAEVSDLQPHHCSYPDGQRESQKHRGFCCRGSKTTSGVCENHLHVLLPRLFAEGASEATIKHRVRILEDPRLAELNINVLFADEYLRERAKAVENGGLSVRMATALRVVQAKAKKHYDGIVDEAKNRQMLSARLMAATDEREKKNISKDIEKSSLNWSKHFEMLGQALKNIENICSVTEKDHANWRELSTANLASVQVKQAAHDVAIKKRDIVSIEEARRCFIDMMRAVEESVKEKLPPKQAEDVLKNVWARTQSMRGASLN